MEEKEQSFRNCFTIVLRQTKVNHRRFEFRITNSEIGVLSFYCPSTELPAQIVPSKREKGVKIELDFLHLIYTQNFMGT